MQEFSFGLWRLWKNKNEVVFNGVHQQPLEVLKVWRRNISDFRDAMSRGSTGVGLKSGSKTSAVDREEAKWLKQKYRFIKVNTDAAWCKNMFRTGVGWVSHDFVGLLQDAGGSGIRFCHTAATAKACAIRDAILACIDNGFDNVIIELMPR